MDQALYKCVACMRYYNMFAGQIEDENGVQFTRSCAGCGHTILEAELALAAKREPVKVGPKFAIQLPLPLGFPREEEVKKYIAKELGLEEWP